MSSFEQTNYNTHVLHLNNDFEIRRELNNIKADKKAYDILIQKMSFLHIKLEQVDTRAANMLKQHLRAIGGEAVISKEAYSFTERTTDVLLTASKETFRLLIKKLISLPYGLSKIAKELEKSLFSNYGLISFHNKVMDFRYKTYIMGTLKFDKAYKAPNYSNDKLLEKTDELIKAGVNIINICEETGGSDSIKTSESEKEKLGHLLPLINSIKTKYRDMFISIETDKSTIAKEAIDCGADIIIEVIPLKYNNQMATLISQKKCPIVLMNSSSFYNQPPRPINSVSDVIREIQSNISFAISQGIDKEKIIVEPGIGMGRSKRDNLLLLKQLASFKYLNIPILVGLSKNTLLGESINGKMKKTDISSITANTMAIINGANIIKVDDVEQAITMKSIIDTIRNIDEEI